MAYKINLSTEKGKTEAEALLNDVQRKTKARTITLEDILTACDSVFGSIGIPKKYMNGVAFCIDLNGQNFPCTYYRVPESTHFSAEYKNGSWRLTGIYRTVCKGTKEAEIYLTTAAENALVRVARAN